MRWLPRSIGGRILLATAATLIASVGALVVLIPVVTSGYGGGSPTDIGSRLVSAIVLAALVGVLVAAAASSLVAGSVTDPMNGLAERARGAVSPRGWSVDRSAPTEVNRIAGAFRQIATEASQRQAAAEGERDRLATLLREMVDAVLIVDNDGRIREANPASDRLLGTTGVVGRALVEVAHEHEILDVVSAARRDGTSVGELARFEPRRTVRLAAHRIAGGEVLLTLQDLTKLRHLETVRRDFVANVSHELRRPIASIKAMVEALESGALKEPEVARDFVQRMHQEVDGLTQLTNELLALSRIESGADSLTLVSLIPADLMTESARRIGALAARAQVTLAVDRTKAPAVMADGDRVATVLANLLHNAIKFTPAGGTVRLSAERIDGEVAFSVADTGIGIEPQDLERVFERFYKADRSRASGGTGLGLAIAKHIVQAHGGRIDVKSEGPGRGAIFRFTLPVAS